MSVTISISAFSSTENEEYKKHLKSVAFCIENELSYPKETSEFFKGKLECESDLEDIKRGAVLQYIENGCSVPLKIHSDEYGNVKTIKTSEIPPEVTEIIIKCY